MPIVAPATGTPYRIIMPVEMADIAATPEVATPEVATPEVTTPEVTTPEIARHARPSMPPIAFGAGGQHHRCQNRCGQRLDNKRPMIVHDRTFKVSVIPQTNEK
jgi:hypothetical protein